MASSLNLQRNSEVFFSTVDIRGGSVAVAMTPANTWKLEVLAGFAATSTSATQDITSLESGLNPDRSQQRFNTAINPVDWNIQVYMRPTGVETTAALNTTTAKTNTSGNTKPLADWYMWQALTSSTLAAQKRQVAANQVAEQSIWQTGGTLVTKTIAAGTRIHASSSNFAIAPEYFMYFKLDNVVYQVDKATVNSATVDAGIEDIAATTWSGFGTTMKELVGAPRDIAIATFGGIKNAGGAAVEANSASVDAGIEDIAAVTWSGFGTVMKELVGAPRDIAIATFGGIKNSGAVATANSNAHALTAASAYHPFNTMNVAGTVTTNAFIKNRLSAIEFHHKASATASDEKFTFPVTSMNIEYTNNITYLTPEQISALNEPIGQFSGTRSVTGTTTMYLRSGDLDSAGFLRNISEDARTNSAQTSNANVIIGGATAPYVAFQMDAAQFSFPAVQTEDVISMSVDFMAQETNANKGSGGEVTIVAIKA